MGWLVLQLLFYELDCKVGSHESIFNDSPTLCSCTNPNPFAANVPVIVFCPYVGPMETDRASYRVHSYIKHIKCTVKVLKNLEKEVKKVWNKV